MNYKFIEIDSKKFMTSVDDMIGIACSLNSQNYENLMKLRLQLETDLKKMYEIEKS